MAVSGCVKESKIKYLLGVETVNSHTVVFKVWIHRHQKQVDTALVFLQLGLCTEMLWRHS